MTARTRRSLRRLATKRTARRRRVRLAPPERPPASPTPFPWLCAWPWEAEDWGATAIELELLDYRTPGSATPEPV